MLIGNAAQVNGKEMELNQPIEQNICVVLTALYSWAAREPMPLV